MKKKNLLLFLRLLVSAGLIAYFVYVLSRQFGGLDIALKNFSEVFSGASLYWLLPAGAMHIVGFSLTSLRWKVLLQGQDVHSSFGRLFTYYFMASFFNLTLPSTIGGDAVRAMESRKLTGSASTSVMVVVIERLTGLAALVFIAATGLVISFSRNTEGNTQKWLILFLVLSLMGLVIFLARPKIAHKLLNVTAGFLPARVQGFLVQAYTAVETYYKRPASLLTAQLISIVFQVNMLLYYYFIARALQQHPDPVDFMIKIPIVIFLLMTVPAINGIGVRTASFKTLMKFPAAYALAVETLDLMFRIGYGLLGGLVFLLHRRTGAAGDNTASK
ncbi:MAG: flippase-like domain-containing protein [bacterium]|nr:flippase-like domain-containing protein [bacterium]